MDISKPTNTAMPSDPAMPTRFYHKRPTPWPIRIFLAAAILFGVWVDLSGDVATSRPADGRAAVRPTQPPLIGLEGDRSKIADVVRSLAARH